jgi:hypothetical protein
MTDQERRALERDASDRDPQAEALHLRATVRAAASAFAVLGEVDGNVEALRAVLGDLDSLGIREVVCVGNTVGRGPDPEACVDLVRERAAVVLRGCRDEAATGPLGALTANLPLRHARGPDVFVHATPDDPVHGVFRLRVGDRRLDPAFSAFERFLFCAHHDPEDRTTSTVLPLVVAAIDETLPPYDPNVIDYGLEGLDRYGAWGPDALPRFSANGRKAVVIVGSVGLVGDAQGFAPDPRACYAVVVDDTLFWRRVAYDRTRVDEHYGVTGARALHRLRDESLPIHERAEAIFTLRDRGDRRAIPALRALLRGTDMTICGAASEALGVLGARAAIPDLMDLLRDEAPEERGIDCFQDPFGWVEDSPRECALRGLGQLRAVEAIPAIRALLRSGEPFVRREAVRALARIGAREALPEIATLFQDPEAQVREAAREAARELEAIPERPPRPLETPFEPSARSVVATDEGERPIPSVGWRGLRRLDSVRTIAAGHAERSVRPHHLGGGVIVYETRGRRGSLAVSILTGQVLWRTDLAPLLVVGGRLLFRDAASRAFHAVDLDGRSRELGPIPNRIDAASLFAVGETTAATLITHEDNSDWGSEKPTERELVLVDVERGAIAAELSLPRARGATLVATPSLVFGSLFGTGGKRARTKACIAAWDWTGREAFRVASSTGVLGLVDGRVVVTGPDELEAVELATGRTVSRVRIARAPESPRAFEELAVTESALVVRREGELVGLDRRTLALLWRRELRDETSVVTTADAVVLTGREPGDRRRIARRVTSLDPPTGVELSSLEIASHEGGPWNEPIAGRLVSLAYTGAPVVVVVEASSP